MKKNKITVFILLLHSAFVFGQEPSHPELLDTDWGKEIFEFPIRFAQEIDYKGFEEARFPKGWSNQDTLTFWSYVFAWSVDLESELTADDLERDLQFYFDGLMNIEIMQKNGEEVQNTLAIFLKKDDSTFIGKIKTYDRFSTKKPMILNVQVETHYCQEGKKSLILFRFSPKDLEHKVWEILKKVKFRSDICDL